MKNIAVGYLDVTGKKFISNIVINDILLTSLAHYVKVTIIPVEKKMEYIKEIFRKMDRYRLDYLYINTYNFLLVAFLLRERFKLNIPFIFELHTVYPWIDQYLFSIPLIRKYDIIYAPSRYARESFLRISDKFKVHLIPYFLDINSIQRNISRNSENNKKVITFMGRLVKEKGIGILIGCMPEVLSRAGNAHLNIIGPLSGRRITDYPKDRYVKDLERTVSRLKLTDRVHFKGVQLGPDKYRILSESDIFINPTLAKEEAFPVVNIEALACGVPVIATDWAGNRELIRSGENGFLVNVNYGKNKKPKIDAEHLVSLIVEVLMNKQLNLEMRKKSLRTALSYDYRKVLPRLVSLLKKRPKTRAKNSWDLIKNKRVTDFRHLFNKGFLFFIYFDNSLRTETYSSLYKKCLAPSFLKRRDYSDTRKKPNRQEAKDIEIYKKLRQDFSDLLLLKR